MQFGIRVFHGTGSSCEDLESGTGPIWAAVPTDATLHLSFPEPVIATHATENWCLFIEQPQQQFTYIIMVGGTS